MSQQFISPEFQKNWFTCPHCWAFSKQEWEQLYANNNWWISMATCDHCNKISIWFWNADFYNRWLMDSGNIVYPKSTNIPLPNEDLDQKIQEDYLEASNIVNDSPRWACALLRLALQKLMIQLWESGKDINNDIGNLVKKWLNPTIQQALDTVRVIWNESVHPWEIDMKDNTETATQLFGLINIIAEFLITQPRKIAELYWTLPEGKLKWIEDRDAN